MNVMRWSVRISTRILPKLATKNLRAGFYDYSNQDINLLFLKTSIEERSVVVLEISRALNQPVRFRGQEYIRAGS